jgi:BCD family chlorophyll transporter-like MFS transporter
MAFTSVALIALLMGAIGLLGLEPRSHHLQQVEKRYPLGVALREIRSNRQVSLFFFYLVLMLAAVLGQDVLLEPFAARAFDWPVATTTRITSIWGTCYLLSLLIAGVMEGRISKITIARLASWTAVAAFTLVAASGLLKSQAMFYTAVVLLGLATGPATVSNLSLMLDMTVPGKVGLFIGAWGSASAFARLLGSLVTAGVRDLGRLVPGAALLGYAAAFLVLGLFLVVSLLILRKIDVSAFQKQTTALTPAQDASLIERAVMSQD